MSEFDFSDIGKQIKDSVQDIANSKEVNELKENIKNTAESAAQSVKDAVKDAAGNVNKGLDRYQSRFDNYRSTANLRRDAGPKVSVVKQKHKSKKKIGRPVGAAAGIVMLVFGILGMLSGGLMAVGGIFFEIFAYGWVGTDLLFGLSVPTFLLSGFLTVRGNIISARAARFKIYAGCLEEKGYAAITQMAEAVKKKKKFVIKDLLRMIHHHWFISGHMDPARTCFMATREAYTLYLETEENAAKQKLLEEQASKEKNEEELYYANNPSAREFVQLVEEGKGYIARIREVNEKIPDKEISLKLDRLEMIGTKIFELVQKDPARLPDTRRFMDYYLPTALKLVNTYYEFDSQPVQGENIKNAKKDIKETLDSINRAFENLFDQLFQEDALDIATDISVLSTMLAQEGLLGSDFEQKED